MASARPILIGSMLIALAACSSSDDDESTAMDTVEQPAGPGTDGGDTNEPDTAMSAPDGVRVTGSLSNVGETIGTILGAIEGNEAIGLVANVDHSANAANADITLRPTNVVLFGNPRLGTPLMQASRTAGLDLPQKMLAWETGAGDTRLAWNGADWLAARHGIAGEDAESALETIDMALAGLATNASGQELEAAGGPSTVENGAGIETLVSNQSFEATYEALQGAVASADPLTIVAELDHRANAARVDLELPPTRLIVFGNPALGSQLMGEQQSIGIDLPQKMLVYEEDDTVVIAWNDPAWTAARHGVTGQDDTVATIATALGNLAAAAAGEAGDN